jgi:acyl-CoA-binding protein
MVPFVFHSFSVCSLCSFTEAVELMKKLKPKFELQPEEKLRLNSLYNHSKHGECTIEKPSMIDVSGIEQWNAWKALVSSTAFVGVRKRVMMRTLFAECSTGMHCGC